MRQGLERERRRGGASSQGVAAAADSGREREEGHGVTLVS
jgi:hypothetical protein